jgi:hypothetical protein
VLQWSAWLRQFLPYDETNEGVREMKKYVFYILFLLVTVGVGMYAQSVDIDEALKNAAGYFERRLPMASIITIFNVESDSKDLSDYTVNELFNYLRQGRRHTLVNRDLLNSLQLEIEIKLGGYIDDATAVDIGYWLGVETIILGKIQMLGSNYRLDFRALSVETESVQEIFRQDVLSNQKLINLMGKPPEQRKQTMPKNTIIVDFGPLIGPVMVSSVYTGIINALPDAPVDINFFGFGIAAQYERQIFEKFSAGGRFAYMGFNFSDNNEGLKAVLEMKAHSFSLEGHARYYPFGKTFFLDGMLGYANVSINSSGEIIVTDAVGNASKISASLAVSRNYFELGAKLGWRVNFDREGGFTFDSSVGYYGGIGFGDTLGKKISHEIGADVINEKVVAVFENLIFVGGPRLGLAFGWRF